MTPIPDPDTKVDTDHLLAELAACRAEILRLRAVLSDTADELIRAIDGRNGQALAAVERARAALGAKEEGK